MEKKKRSTLKDKLITCVLYLILIMASLIVLLPVIWIVLSSFQQGTSLFSTSFFPKDPTIKHYVNLFTETDFPLWYLNTLKIATANMVISVLITTLTAYAFSRFRFKGRKSGLMTMMLLQMFPSMLAMVAIVTLVQKIGLLNSHWGLILVYAGGQIPYNAWLCKGYFDGIPRSLDEAARIDGASNLKIFTTIIMPLARPIVVMVALQNFMGPWFDYIFPRLILKSASKKTLAMGLFEWIQKNQNNNFTMFAAGAILVAIPITLLFMYLQRHIVEGLAAGATKG